MGGVSRVFIQWTSNVPAFALTQLPKTTSFVPVRGTNASCLVVSMLRAFVDEVNALLLERVSVKQAAAVRKSWMNEKLLERRRNSSKEVMLVQA